MKKRMILMIDLQAIENKLFNISSHREMPGRRRLGRALSNGIGSSLGWVLAGGGKILSLVRLITKSGATIVTEILRSTHICLTCELIFTTIADVIL